MARPREHTDDQLLDSIGGALARRTALRRWTLAEVAEEAGVAPATLVKRFGSRHGLLTALSRRWIDSIPVAGPSTQEIDELFAWVSDSHSGSRDRASALLGMLLLMEDLSDGELAGLLIEGWTKQIDYLAASLAAAGLMRLGSPRRGAQLLFDALNGRLLRVAAGDPDSPDPASIARSLVELWT